MPEMLGAEVLGKGVAKWRRYLGVTEIVFLALVAIYGILYATGSAPDLAALVAVAGFVVGVVALIRLLRRSLRKAIWRLRNRLIAAYLLIAVVPIVLILTLAGIAAYAVVGQMAVYMVDSELSRRITFLNASVAGLRMQGVDARLFLSRMAPLIETRFPHFDLLLEGKTETRYPADSHLKPPPDEWQEANGLVVKNKQVYAWVHDRSKDGEITLMAPLSHDLLTNLVPGLGDVDLAPFTLGGRQSPPPKRNALDLEIPFAYPEQLESWDSPHSPFTALLLVDTRPSAVLGTIFGQKGQWAEAAMTLFVAVGILFLLVELASLFFGVRLSRTITGAVHELYAGTQHVKEGDFSYRIPVRGNDQLAELGASFNTMTDNLGRLIAVAKENERLQSELAIAREVQAQLFPKAAPSLRGLKLAGVCQPARSVSGDYYDFLSISERAVAFAIGDVAGKGISAALLMAAIQSNMRTQLAATDGNRPNYFSAASLVGALNRQLYANTAPEKYATFYFALYDDVEHVVTYTNAGHLPPMLVRKQCVDQLEPTGTVVGAFPSARYEEQKIALEPGDILVAYTDGMVEPENVYGEMFGEERLRDLVLRHAGEDSDEMIARAMEAVVQWTGSTELQDDMTMLVARRV
ncbi:MAG TPA: SpoIIE family protein phosphatase [Bryobacteraceae bacterium]|jgi:sigma-B regulation protein RsbU (phosphoserine phosphatase)